MARRDTDCKNKILESISTQEQNTSRTIAVATGKTFWMQHFIGSERLRGEA